MLVTKTDEGVHVSAVTKNDKSGSQQSHADSTLVPQSELQSILHEYKDYFPEVLHDGLPPERDVAHTIPTEAGVPPLKPIYRLSPAENAEVERQITEGLRRGIIEPSSSPFEASVLFVRKKDGSLRMCVDYRATRGPLRISIHCLALMTCLISCMVLQCFLPQSGYPQIRIKDDDVPKTAFRTPLGHYHFRVLSFGLTNAPATFKAAMNR